MPWNFVALYRSPNQSQSQDEIEIFSKNLELNLGTVSGKNTFLTVVLDDFNAKSKLCIKMIKQLMKVPKLTE